MKCRLAASLLALTACKADLHQTADAQPLDTAVDTLTPSTGDPPANAVKLTVMRVGDPVANVAVFFQGADSSLIAQSLTDEHGVAWAIMPSGGFVTAREHVGQGIERLNTFAGVQTSDALELDLSPTGTTSEHLFHITVPTSATAIAYRVFSPCGESAIDSPSADIRLVGCNTMTDLVIVPVQADGSMPDALFAPNVTIDGTVAILGTYQSFETVSLNYTNVPDFVAFVGMYEALSATRRAYSDTDGVATSNNAASADVMMPASTGTELTATNLFPISGEIGIQTLYNWHSAGPTVDLDVGTVLLPPFATAPVFSQPTRTLSWTERTGDLQPDVVRARIHVYRDAIPSGTAWSWRIVAARSGTSITYPQLPVIDNFDFTPLGGDTITVDELSTISLPGGFAGFHTKGFSEPRGAISGTLGRIVQQDLYFESL